MQHWKPYRRAGAVATGGSLCWAIGISMVGNVHATKDAAARLEMLERHRRLWILGQFLAAAGTAATPMGFARFARQLGTEPGPSSKAGRKLAAVSAAAMLAGGPLFIAALADRAAHLRKFAYREGASWPFLSYAGLQTAGIGALGAALLVSPVKGPAAVGSAVSAPLFAAILLRYKDIPPFVFYLLELAVGIRLLRYEPGGQVPGGRAG